MDGNRCVVDLSWNVLLSDWFFRRPGFSFWRATPLRLLLLALPALFDSMILSPGSLPPGSQSAKAPLFGFLCGSVSCLRPWFCGSTLTRPHLLAPPLLADKWVCVYSCSDVARVFVTAPRCISRSRSFSTTSRRHGWPHLAAALP